jgi:hypothetical protein
MTNDSPGRRAKKWADRLMSEHNYDRSKALTNIPKKLNSELQEYIADKLKTSCWGPPGGPHCICSFPEIEDY